MFWRASAASLASKLEIKKEEKKKGIIIIKGGWMGERAEHNNRKSWGGGLEKIGGGVWENGKPTDHLPLFSNSHIERHKSREGTFEHTHSFFFLSFLSIERARHHRITL